MSTSKSTPKSPRKYKPYRGVEYAFSPELIDPMNDRVDTEEYVEDLDLSGLRPVASQQVTTTYRLGRHDVLTTITIISNRPINTNNTGATS